MTAATKIEWTDMTWNPVTGCTKVSQGCKNCYAEGVANRFWAKQYRPVLAHNGKTIDSISTSHHEDYLRDGLARPRRFTDVQCHPDRLDEPLRWRKPRRVFVNSMSDLFHEDVPDEFIDRVFAVMALAPMHTFQVLTKRPERMRDYMAQQVVGWEDGFHYGHRIDRVQVDVIRALPDALAGSACSRAVAFDGGVRIPPWPLPNVWLGTSVEDQRAADERIPLLLQTPAAVRFLSCEPLLSGLDLTRRLRPSRRLHLRADVEGMLRNRAFSGLTDESGRQLSRTQAAQRLRELLASGVRFLRVGACDSFDPASGCPGHAEPKLDWVIVGGESGPGARPCDVAWVRSIVEQCQAAGVPAFVKQLGAVPVAITSDPMVGLIERVAQEHQQGLSWPSGARFGNPSGDAQWNGRIALLRDRKGGDPSEWPEDLRVREFPAPVGGTS